MIEFVNLQMGNLGHPAAAAGASKKCGAKQTISQIAIIGDSSFTESAVYREPVCQNLYLTHVEESLSDSKTWLIITELL